MRMASLDVVLFQNSTVGEVQRAIQRGLPAHRRQQRVRPFLFDDALERMPVDRFDIHRVGSFRVGHDRCRIRIDQHDAETFLLQRLASLGTGVVELASLADDDRAGADDQDRF
jgi:hypothetical protein